MTKNNSSTLRIVFYFVLSVFLVLCLLYWYVGRYELIRYEYERNINKYDWGEIITLLSTDYKTVSKRLVVRGSPYDLLIVIKTGTENEGKVSLKNMKLIDEDGAIIFAGDGIFELDLENVSDGLNTFKAALFTWDNLEIEYRNYTLVFDLHIKTNKFEVDKKIEIPFKKKYKKEKRNKIRDAMTA